MWNLLFVLCMLWKTEEMREEEKREEEKEYLGGFVVFFFVFIVFESEIHFRTV